MGDIESKVSLWQDALQSQSPPDHDGKTHLIPSHWRSPVSLGLASGCRLERQKVCKTPRNIREHQHHDRFKPTDLLLPCTASIAGRAASRDSCNGCASISVLRLNHSHAPLLGLPIEADRQMTTSGTKVYAPRCDFKPSLLSLYS